jgi:hypothetical protein
VIITAILLILLAMPAHAALEPMSWGFPSLVQNSSLTSFQDMFAWQNNYELTDISFPTIGSSEFGFNSFPTISQVSNNVQVMSNFNYMHQQESSVFSYPWISIGFSPVPSMGFL